MRKSLHQTAKADGSMYNGLPSAKELAQYDHCRGIHGAARERKGIKHARVTARRRLERLIIEQDLMDEGAD